MTSTILFSNLTDLYSRYYLWYSRVLLCLKNETIQIHQDLWCPILQTQWTSKYYLKISQLDTAPLTFNHFCFILSRFFVRLLKNNKLVPNNMDHILSLNWLYIFVNFICRSEMHEKMNCVRCQYDDDRPESIENRDITQLINRSCQSNQDTCDIGGFAENAGCLSKLKSSEKQVFHIY